MRTPACLLLAAVAVALASAPAARPLEALRAATDIAPAAAPDDSTLSALWIRHLDDLARRLDVAEAEPDPAVRADLATGLLRTARALADEPEVQRSRRLQALVRRTHAFYESLHGPTAPTPMTAAHLHALRADGLADAVETAGHPALPEVPDALPPTIRTVSGNALALHLAYPVEAQALVDRQARVARRFRGLRSRRVLRTIERTFRRRGLPPDLKYVAVIESSLNPQAESHAGARGLWQFMPETADEFGLDSLTVLDPVRSTEAAARYLRQLGRMFRGDWQLALAAYNAGPGRVQTLVRRYRAETGRYPSFWDIQADLPRETRHYVPRFIAVTQLLGPVPDTKPRRRSRRG